MLIILIGFGLLNLPFAKNNGSHLSWFDSLFISVSAFTTTGLTPSSISNNLSFFGQLIILLLIQTGGLGIITLWMLVKKSFFQKSKLTIKERLNIQSERGGVSIDISYEVIKTSVKILITCEIIISILLFFLFYFISPSTGTFSTSCSSILTSIWYGIFHSISAVNNAGLDIIWPYSISLYSKNWGILLSIIFAFASIIGGIGYPVLYDLRKWYTNRRWNRDKNQKVLSLFSKISISTYVVITLLSSIGIILSETLSSNLSNIKSHTSCTCSNHTLNNSEKIWQLIYLAISSRSSGFYGILPKTLHEKTQWILLFLMFIGASPASTAGGIRSITLFLILGKIWITIKGKRYLSVFSRTISDKTIENAIMVFICSIILVAIPSLLIKSESCLGKHAALFEASSAFGTSGLSLGVTEKTDHFGKIILMILMFIGQLGVPNTLLYWRKTKISKKNFSFPVEKIRIA